MKKFSAFLFFTALGVLLLAGNATAATLSFNPSDSTIGVGESVDVDIDISGLENDNLSAFDFTVEYDSSVLSFDSYEFGDQLGDIDNFEAIDASQGDNLIEVSWLGDFGFQDDDFTLATLSFTGDSVGESPLSLSDIELYDDSWPSGTLNAEPGSGYVEVTAAAVPIPSTVLLLGSGILGLAGFRKKCRKN